LVAEVTTSTFSPLTGILSPGFATHVVRAGVQVRVELERILDGRSVLAGFAMIDDWIEASIVSLWQFCWACSFRPKNAVTAILPNLNCIGAAALCKYQ
jgi:hypothetical protein